MATTKNFPIAKQVEQEILAISDETFGDINVLESVIAILKKIEFCNNRGLYSTGRFAVKRGIARCKVEIDYASATCAEGKEAELYESLCKKYGVKYNL